MAVFSVVLCEGFPLEEKDLDEIIHSLQGVKNQMEVEHMPREGESPRKRFKNKDIDRPGLDSNERTLMYDYYANTMAPINRKRMFMPIHGKRTPQSSQNSQMMFKEVEPINPGKEKDSKIYGTFSKSNFKNEADQYGFDNFYKRNFEEYGSYN
ncbi:hypothetical protein DMENIID0001_097550 [Sergentomyia squamirostris]